MGEIQEFTIEAADNGYIIRGEEMVQVVEDGEGDKNTSAQLGRLIMDDITAAMNRKITNIVKIKYEISSAMDEE